jgi:hypothetical protein
MPLFIVLIIQLSTGTGAVAHSSSPSTTNLVRFVNVMGVGPASSVRTERAGTDCGWAASPALPATSRALAGPSMKYALRLVSGCFLLSPPCGSGQLAAAKVYTAPGFSTRCHSPMHDAGSAAHESGGGFFFRRSSVLPASRATSGDCVRHA